MPTLVATPRPEDNEKVKPAVVRRPTDSGVDLPPGRTAAARRYCGGVYSSTEAMGTVWKEVTEIPPMT
jgi:hypothetical protein